MLIFFPRQWLKNKTNMKKTFVSAGISWVLCSDWLEKIDRSLLWSGLDPDLVNEGLAGTRGLEQGGTWGLEQEGTWGLKQGAWGLEQGTDIWLIRLWGLDTEEGQGLDEDEDERMDMFEGENGGMPFSICWDEWRDCSRGRGTEESLLLMEQRTLVELNKIQL